MLRNDIGGKHFYVGLVSDFFSVARDLYGGGAHIMCYFSIRSNHL